MGGVANFVGDTISSVIDTVTDHPLETAVLIAAPYLAGEVLAGEAIGAGGLGADLIAPEITALSSAGTSAGLGGIGAGLIAPEVTALGASFGANTFPSLDFISSFIPKTPADIAKTLGTSALLSTATNALINKPEVAGVNMNIPQSNIPQYGTGKTIFDSYNSAKKNINDILYPQGLLGTQPRTAGIYSNYLQQQGLI